MHYYIYQNKYKILNVEINRCISIVIFIYNISACRSRLVTVFFCLLNSSFLYRNLALIFRRTNSRLVLIRASFFPLAFLLPCQSLLSLEDKLPEWERCGVGWRCAGLCEVRGGLSSLFRKFHPKFCFPSLTVRISILILAVKESLSLSIILP